LIGPSGFSINYLNNFRRHLRRSLAKNHDGNGPSHGDDKKFDRRVPGKCPKLDRFEQIESGDEDSGDADLPDRSRPKRVRSVFAVFEDFRRRETQAVGQNARLGMCRTKLDVPSSVDFSRGLPRSLDRRFINFGSEKFDVLFENLFEFELYIRCFNFAHVRFLHAFVMKYLKEKISSIFVSRLYN